LLRFQFGAEVADLVQQRMNLVSIFGLLLKHFFGLFCMSLMRQLPGSVTERLTR
jgi:hypothetical protein